MKTRCFAFVAAMTIGAAAYAGEPGVRIDVRPTITTVSYDKAFLVKGICGILNRRLKENRPKGEHILIPSALMERESTGGKIS